MKSEFYGKNIIITGASRGLGRELAKSFASYGANLCLCSRNIDQLEKTNICSGGGAEDFIKAD